MRREIVGDGARETGSLTSLRAQAPGLQSTGEGEKYKGAKCHELGRF